MLHMKWRFRWDDVDRFEYRNDTENWEEVVFRTSDLYTGPQRIWFMTSGDKPKEMIFPSTYGYSGDELAEFLNEYRRKAGI